MARRQPREPRRRTGPRRGRQIPGDSSAWSRPWTSRRCSGTLVGSTSGVLAGRTGDDGSHLQVNGGNLFQNLLAGQLQTFETVQIGLKGRHLSLEGTGTVP